MTIRKNKKKDTTSGLVQILLFIVHIYIFFVVVTRDETHIYSYGARGQKEKV